MLSCVKRLLTKQNETKQPRLYRNVSDQVLKNFVKYCKRLSIFSITQNMTSKLSFTFFMWGRAISLKEIKILNELQKKKVIKVELSPSKKVVLTLIKIV